MGQGFCHEHLSAVMHTAAGEPESWLVSKQANKQKWMAAWLSSQPDLTAMWPSFPDDVKELLGSCWVGRTV